MAARDSPFIRHAPNVLTTLRLAVVPVFAAVVIAEGGPTLGSGLIFLAAAFTDFFDGFIARHFRVMSQYGKVLDPIADRLLVNSAAILLCVYDSRWFAGEGRLLGPEFIIVLARDVLAIYGYWRVREYVIPDVTRVGKWGMALMMAGLTWTLLLPDAIWPLWPFWLGLALSVVAIFQYLRRYSWVLDPEKAAQRGTGTGID